MTDDTTAEVRQPDPRLVAAVLVRQGGRVRVMDRDLEAARTAGTVGGRRIDGGWVFEFVAKPDAV